MRDGLLQLLTGAQAKPASQDFTLACQSVRQYFKNYFERTGQNANFLLNDPLVFWKQAEESGSPFKNLADLARCVLAVPATSAGSERIFSYTGMLVAPRRARIAPDTVRMYTVAHGFIKNMSLEGLLEKAEIVRQSNNVRQNEIN